MADDDIYYGDVLRSDSPVYKDYENCGGEDVISGEDDGYEPFGSLVSADTKGSNWSLEAIFEERNGLCEDEEYPPPVLHERLSERTSGSEVYEEQDFYGRQCMKESMQRSNSGTASTRSNTAVKTPAPSYKAPVVPQRSVYGNRSSKRPAPPVPQVPPRVKVKPVVSKGVMTEQQKHILRQSWNKIVDYVRSEDIVDNLIQEGVFDLDMRQEIMAPPVPRERTIRLMDRLLTRGSEAYHQFMDVLKLKYDFVYREIRDIEACSMEDADSHMFNYHETPMDGETLKNSISNMMHFVPRSKTTRRQKQRDIEEMARAGLVTPPPSIGRKQGKLIQKIETATVKLDSGEEVFIIDEDDYSTDEVKIMTRFGLAKIPRSLIKVKGDLTNERYCYQEDLELKANEAWVFVDHTVKKSKRNGVFVVYKPRGGCQLRCEHHLCVGFFKGNVKNYHIRNNDGYFLRAFDVDTGSTYMTYEKQSQTKFPNITDLIDFFKYTSDKILDGPLQWPMRDAEAPLKAEEDFRDPIRVLRKTDYNATSTLLGRGYYANVTKGTMKLPGSGTVILAIKSPNRLNQTRDKMDELYKEAKILATLNDENVLKLIGVCFTDNVAHMVTELASKGCLLDIVRKRTLSKRYSSNDMTLFRDYTQQIASGMKHLEEQQIVHRDLALRNILVFENNVVKIADLGQARRLFGPQHNYHVTKSDVISRRWTAPEVLVTFRHFLKSDVWSFGVVLYELYSYGETPYKRLKTQHVLGFVVIEDGILDKPTRCPDDIYTVMRSCRVKDIKKRQSFYALFESLLLQNYQSLHPGVLHTVMKEDDYAQSIKSAMTLDRYEETYINNSNPGGDSTGDDYSPIE